MAERLLSICVPTFNRAAILKDTIDSYVNDPAFDERVEIVISDNCSTDPTMSVVSEYTGRYGNIRYNRLPENIGADMNMCTVLSMGEGLYLKLMNDTAMMKPGVLKGMLEKLETAKGTQEPLFFYQNIPFLNSDRTVSCSDLNDLVSNVSFHITWISNFGIWRNRFESMDDKNRLAHLLFPQTDWTLRLVSRAQCAKIHFGDFYRLAELKSKGGYNFFQVFGINYLSLYDEYLKRRSLRHDVYRTEKYRLFRYYLLNRYKHLVVTKNEIFRFEKEKAFRVLIKNYGTKPYFYFGIIYLYLRNLLKIVGGGSKRSVTTV